MNNNYRIVYQTINNSEKTVDVQAVSGVRATKSLDDLSEVISVEKLQPKQLIFKKNWEKTHVY